MDTSTRTDPRIARSFRLQHAKTQGGQALVIVMSFMMLMMVLVLVFFGSVQTDSLSARSSAGGVGARQLAQSAVQVVEGIISKATLPGSDTNTAWANQPGMIRTFGTAAGASVTPSSAPLNYYKLYSAPQMVVTPGSTPSSTNFTPDSDLSTTWDTSPAFFTDLNSPVYDSAGHLQYPVVDPRAQETASKVQGFSYGSTTPAGTSIDGVVTASGSESLPMPVQWLYVLQDGTMVAPNSGTGSTATFASWNTSNPIVGRVAFWTDDECAKVNLNTASEGTYWDTPIAVTGKTTDKFSFSLTGDPTGHTQAFGDVIFATLIPSTGEFPRYPGHPASTCLSEVLGSDFASGANRGTISTNIDVTTPRMSDLPNSATTFSTTQGGTQLVTPSLTPTAKFDRLYPTVDDFSFSPTRVAQDLGASSATLQQTIERSHFFLTTTSKSSDLNPFGLPKVTIWPVWDNAHAGNLSTLDKSMIHTSTMASGAAAGYQHQMIFTRGNPNSATYDWTTTDVNGAMRNQALFEYLETLTNRPIPGFGTSFNSTAKYGATVNGTTDIDSILAEIFDYIRCTNLADNSVGHSFTPIPSAGYNSALGQVVPIQLSGTVNGGSPRGMGRIETISEIALDLVKIDDRKNSGSPDAPANLATTVNVNTGDTNSPSVTTFSPASQTCIEWTLIPKMFCAMAGYPALGNDIQLAFSNFSLAIGGVTVQPPSDYTPGIYDTGRVGTSTRDSLIGGGIGYYDLVLPASHNSYYPPKNSMYPTGLVVISGQSAAASGMAVGSATATTTIAGGFTVTITAPHGGSPAVQTLQFSFPSTSVTTVPIPEIPGTQGTWRSSTYTAGTTATFTYTSAITGGVASENPSRLGGNNFSPSTINGGNTDVVRSLVSTGSITSSTGTIQLDGDMRLISLMGAPAATAFNTDWSNPSGAAASDPASTANASVFLMDSLHSGVLFKGAGMATGTLVPGTNWLAYGGGGSAFQPEVPVLPSTTTMLPQMTADGNLPPDWDNAVGLLMDGPYFNKVDEGQGYGNTNAFNNMVYIDSYDATVHPTVQGSTYFSPNRQVSSPVMFGSLLAGLDHPWRTLLFRPASLPGYQETAGTTYTHPGFGDGTAPDHLLLDFFRMPIVEPYCISEPLATAGKVNLNTQIVPFTYIQRTTGLRAVLKSVMITAVNPSLIGSYKNSYLNSTDTSITASAAQQAAVTRYAIDLTDTINQIMVQNDTTATYNFPEFNRPTYTALNPNFFISPSQICDLPLIPLSAAGAATYTSTAALNGFWKANTMTGDNSLEKPYSLIYPRVTTQSNVFTVHVRAQSLKQVASDVTAGTWTEGKSAITGEYRGSFTVEKYFDPSYAVIAKSDGSIQSDANDASIDATAAVRGDNYDPASPTGDAIIQHGLLWRLLESKRFGE